MGDGMLHRSGPNAAPSYATPCQMFLDDHELRIDELHRTGDVRSGSAALHLPVDHHFPPSTHVHLALLPDDALGLPPVQQ